MSKRGNNEGSIFEYKKHGKMRWAVELEDANGIRRRFHPKTNRRAAAADLLAEKIALVKKRLPLVDSNEKMNVVFDRWLGGQLPTLRKSTLTMYEHLVRNHLKSEFGEIKLIDMKRARIQEWVNNMLTGRKSATTGIEHKSLTTGQLYSVTTVHHAFKLLSVVLADQVTDQLLTYNPADGVKFPEVENGKGLHVAVMEPEEHDQFFSHKQVKKSPYWMVFRVLDALGLRRNEALALKWGDFHFDAKLPTGEPCPYVEISGSLSAMKIGKTADETKLLIDKPKTAAGKRRLPLGPKLIAQLQEHHSRQLAAMADNPEWQDHGLVFTTKNGTPFSPRNVNRGFTLALKTAKLPSFRLHSLRHGVATEMVDNKVPMKIISDFLGHSQIGVTMNFYAKSRMSGLQKAGAITDEREPA